jgi:cbb3-type cytochrome oxidase subunit 3
MELLEKQQTVEAIRVVVRARWFYASIIFVQGMIVRLFLPKVPLAGTMALSLILFSSFIFNIGYWFYLRRPAEKMSDWGLQIVKALQVIADFIWITAILYFSGTVGKMTVLLYFVAIMIGASLYQRKGVVFSTLAAQFLFTVLAVLQYKGLMGAEVSGEEVFSFDFGVGNKEGLAGVLIGFYSYSSASAVFAGYLAGLFRKREKGLREQRDRLTLAQSDLQSALIRSDVAGRAATKARDEMGKANVELKQKMEELERFYKMTVGREVKMEEMKKKIKELEKGKEE